jgi:signal transduction histidine kinase
MKSETICTATSLNCKNEMTQIQLIQSGEHTPVFIVDSDGYIVKINSKALGKQPIKSFIGTDIHSHVFIADSPSITQKAFFRDSWYDLRSELIRYNNEECKKMVLVKEIGYPGIDELKNVQRMSEVLVHRVRSPLTGMQGYLEMVLEGEDELNPKSKERLQKVDNGIQYLFDMMDNLKQIYDQNIVNENPTSASADTKKSVNELINVYPEEIQKKIKVVFNNSGDKFNTDQTTLYSVLSILLSNALEHGGNGDKTVKIQFDSPYQVSITNRGKRIDEKLKNDIFQPFVTSKADHMGLGLTLAYMYAKKSNGNISLSSNKKDEITFTFSLPPEKYLK